MKDLHRQLQDLQNEMLLGKNRLATNEQPLMPNRKPLEEEKKGGLETQDDEYDDEEEEEELEEEETLQDETVRPKPQLVPPPDKDLVSSVISNEFMKKMANAITKKALDSKQAQTPADPTQ